MIQNKSCLVDPEAFALKTVKSLAQWTAQWDQRQELKLDLESPWSILQANHWCNYTQWDLENELRSSLTPLKLAQTVLSLQAHNHARNEAIRNLDKWVLGQIVDMSGPWHSETPGMMLDRVSILSLKTIKGDWADASERLDDLMNCFVQLLKDIHCGKQAFKVYQPMKTYTPKKRPIGLFDGVDRTNRP